LSSSAQPSCLHKEQTLAWLSKFVIKKNLCPFAALPLARDEVLVRVSDAGDDEDMFEMIKDEISSLLDPATKQTTTLVVFSNPDYLKTYIEQYHASYSILEYIYKSDLTDQVQLVNFHPQFVNSLYTDPSMIEPTDYVGRSPYPTVHLLRTEDLKTASIQYGNDTELIPTRNAAKLVEIGLDMLREEFDRAHEPQAPS
jgi:hypothetical protein